MTDEKDTHEHHYVFLREETITSKQWNGRVNERQVFDVFFCEGCLKYERRHTRTEEPSSRDFSWEVTWRAP